MVDQGLPMDAQCPSSAALLGYGGVAAAVCLSNWGSAVSEIFASHHMFFTLWCAKLSLICVLANLFLRYRWELGKPDRVSSIQELDTRHQ